MQVVACSATKMSNTVITNYTDLNGPSTKADSSVVVIVNKDGSLSVDQNLLGTLMGSDGSQGAGISVVRVGHEGKPDDATDTESDDEKIPHVTLSVDSYYDEPNSIIKYDSGAEMLQSLRIETRENSLLGFQNDHCYTPLVSSGSGASQRSNSFSGFDEPVLEITHTPPPKPVPQSKKIQILEQQIIPRGRKLLLNPTEPQAPAKGRDVITKPAAAHKTRQLGEADKSSENSESSSISSAESIVDRDSDSDYREDRTSTLNKNIKKSKSKARILKAHPTRAGKLEAKVASRFKAGKNIIRKEFKERLQHKQLLARKSTHAQPNPNVPSGEVQTPEAAKVVPKQIPKTLKKEKKTPAHVTALLSDMTSLFSTPDVIRRVSDDVKTPGKPEPPTRKAMSLLKPHDKDPKTLVQQKLYMKQKEKGSPGDKVTKYDTIPQLDDASLAQILQDTSGITSTIPKVQQIAASNTMTSPGLAGPLSPTLDLLGGLQPEEEGLTEDLLMHVAQLVESSENLQEVIDKQVLGKVDGSVAKSQAPFQQGQAGAGQTPAKTIIPQKNPIEIVRRDGRVITLPPIEAPATRASKRKTQLETPSSSDMLAAQLATPSQPPPIMPEPLDEIPKHFIKKDPVKPEPELLPQAPVADKISAEVSQDSWNSEDDPYRLWCICKQPHNNRFMICCDSCEEWFHGKCVNITKAMGQQMEEQGIEWRCPNCDKKSDKPQRPIKQSLPSQSHTRHESREALSAPSSSRDRAMSPKSRCIVCKRPSRASSIYCSDACILKHAQDSLGTNESPTKAADSQQKPKSDSRVIVFERKTGRLLAGPNAPTAENLRFWLQKNPTFEVVRPGTLHAIKPNLIKKKPPIDPKETKRIQTTLNFERIPRKSAENNPFIKHPNVEARERAVARMLQSPKEEQRQSPLPRTPVQARPQPQDTPRPSTSTAKPASEPKKPARAVNRPHSTYDKGASVSPSTPRRKEAPDTKKRMESIEPIRDNVRKALQEQMTIRMNETKGSRLSKEEIKQFAIDTEFELHELFKDVGMKYKVKYRSLIFNIKDRKNLSLWQKICERKLSPKQLVRLSPEELASQELAQWREEESKHQLELIKKSELDLLAASKTYVLKTHKGEEVMQTKESVTTELDSSVPVEDVVTVLNETINEDTPADTSKEETPSKSESSRSKSGSKKRARDDDNHSKKSSRASKRESERKSKSSRPESETKDRDERSTRRSDRKSRRDRSPSREKEKPKAEVKEKESERSRRRSRSRHSRRDKSREHSRSGSKGRSQSRTRRRSSSRDDTKRRRSTRNKTSSTEDKPSARARSHDNVKAKNESTDSDSIERPKSAMLKELHPEYDPHEPMITSACSEEDLRKTGADSYGVMADYSAADYDDPTKDFTIDTSIELPPMTMKFPMKHDKSETESDQEPSSTVDNTALSVWNGCINMVDVARFYVAAHEASGSAAEIEEDLSTELDIVGRINPDTVWEYIGKMKRANNKDIVVLRMQAANDEEKMQYIALYSYLSSRNRLGVVKVANTTNVKDIYIVPLPANTALPSVMLPLDGPGLGDSKNHLLLAIVIRQRKRPAPVPALIPKDISPPKVARTTRKRSYTPPPPIAVPKAMPLPATYSSPALSTSVKDKIAASLAAADDGDEPYSPGSSSSGGSAPPAPSSSLTPAPPGTVLRSKMDELNRQIEEQKQQILKMAQADSSVGGEDEAYSPSRPMTPPSNPLADIALPSNLHEILATIKQRETTAGVDTTNP